MDTLEMRMLRLVSARGPRNMPFLARMLRISTEEAESVFAKLIESGVDIRPDIRMDKLGLQRYVAIARPERSYGQKDLEMLFNIMGDYAYLEHYQKLDPSEWYLLLFSAPPSKLNELNAFLVGLSRTSTMQVAGPVALDWMRYHPIRAPWNPAPSEVVVSGPLLRVPSIGDRGPMASFDHQEVLLLSAMQAYPRANLQGLSKALSNWAEAGYDVIKKYASDSTADWDEHLRRSMRFVESYPMHLARGDPGTTAKKHHWAQFTVWWNHLSPEKLSRATMAATSIPYLRTDAAASAFGMYFAVFSVPANLLPAYFDFLGRNAPVGMNVGVLSHFMNYSLPFASFIPAEGGWAWKQEKLETLVATLQSA